MSLMDNPKNEEIMEQNKKEVVFDGKDLIFNVDDIEVKNGKLPDSFNIKERYEISAESLSMLIVALSDGNMLAKLIDDFPRKSRTIYPMKDEYVKKLVEEIAKLENKVNSLQDEVYALQQEIADRDKTDYEREVAPLIQAADAVLIDTTQLSIDGAVAEILRLCEERAAIV